MRRLLVGFALACALVTTGCVSSTSVPPGTLDECGGSSTLSSVDAGTGQVGWRASLSQTSELPLELAGGNALVTGPCGAAVVRVASGDVRFDDTIGGNVLGVLGDELFQRVSTAVDRTAPIRGLDLDTGEETSLFSTNTAFRDASIAKGRLLRLNGDILTASDESRSGADWWVQIPVYRTPHLVLADDLVLVTGGDGSTFAVRISDGTLRWRTVPPVPSTAYSLEVTPTRGTVLTAATTNDDPSRHLVYATDAVNGALRWSRTALRVVAADRDLTVLRTERAFEAVGTVDGRLRWRRPASRIEYPSDVLLGEIRSGTVVVQPRHDTVVGLDGSTGRSRWRIPEASSVFVTVKDVVIVQVFHDRVGGGDEMMGVDARTGARLWNRPVDRPALALAAAPEGKVLVLDGDVVPHSTD
jgi:outer membrane protein assembly factor BamB